MRVKAILEIEYETNCSLKSARLDCTPEIVIEQMKKDDFNNCVASVEVLECDGVLDTYDLGDYPVEVGDVWEA